MLKVTGCRYVLYSIVAIVIALAREAYGQARTLVAGDEVEATLAAGQDVPRLSLRTVSETEVVVFRFSIDDPDLLRGAQARVLLPGGVLAGLLSGGKGKDLAAAVIGRASNWAIELTLARRPKKPVRYALRVTHLQPAAPTAHMNCQDALQSLGINAWIIFLSTPPNPYLVSLPGIGMVKFGYIPPQAARMAPHVSAAAISTLRMGGGSLVDADVTGLNCLLDRFQVNLWDTERGPRPIIKPLNAAGATLCGGANQPICPSNPPQRQWSSPTVTTHGPIARVVIECEEVNISTFVLTR